MLYLISCFYAIYTYDIYTYTYTSQGPHIAQRLSASGFTFAYQVGVICIIMIDTIILNNYTNNAYISYILFAYQHQSASSMSSAQVKY
jgi:hypothetical protein